MGGAIPAGEYLVGWVLLAVTLGCAIGAALTVVRRRLGHLAGAPRATTLALLAIAATLFAHLVPLILGVLTRVTAPATAVALWVVVRAALRSTREDRIEVPPVVQPAGALSWILAGAGVLLGAAYCLAYVRAFAGVHPTSTDALNFHLPGVIRFIQSGSLWKTTEYVPGFAFGNYPQHGDVLLLAVALPWHSLALVRYVDPLLLIVAAVSIYAIAQELGAAKPTSALVACAVLAIKPAVGPALVQVLTDPTFLAGFGAGVLFLIRYWRTGSRGELLLAGLGLGIALGAKWYGLTDVSAVVVVWALAGMLSGRGRGSVGREAGVLIVTIGVSGGIWVLRNLILTGNPVFDYKVSVLGITIFGAPPSPSRVAGGFSIAHYLGSPSVLRTYVWPIWRGDFGVPGLLLVVGACIGAIVSLRQRFARAFGRVDWRVLTLAVAALLAAIAYMITPYSAQGPPGHPLQVAANTRYGVPALLLCAPALAWLTTRLGGVRVVIEALLLASVAVNLHRHLGVGTGRVLLAAVVLVVIVGVYWSLGQRAGRARHLLAVASTVLACGFVGLAYHYQRVLARAPYRPGDPTVDYVLAHAPAHTRVGLGGIWSVNGLIPVAPVFGPRLSNHVAYAGHIVDHMLRAYETVPDFVSALRHGHYALLLIGTGSPPSSRSIEESAARQAGFVPIVRSARLVLLKPRP